MRYKIKTERSTESYDSLKNTLNHLRIEIGKCKEIISISVTDSNLNIESNLNLNDLKELLRKHFSNEFDEVRVISFNEITKC
ncbi:hypothetical protein AB3Y13_22955 [Vibrio alginolyticus]